MTVCNDCGEMLRFSERMGITRHKCDPEILAAQVKNQQDEIDRFRLARARERQARIERFNARQQDSDDISTSITYNVYTPNDSSVSYSSSCSDSSSYSSSDSSSSCSSSSSGD